jgi:hypothetical protein
MTAAAVTASTGAATGAGAAAFFAGAGGAPTATVGNASRNRRATGGSMVDDALLTYSPWSLSHVKRVLLSIPNSLASSCTRALPATALLVLAGGDPRGRTTGTYSSGGDAHRELIGSGRPASGRAATRDCVAGRRAKSCGSEPAPGRQSPRWHREGRPHAGRAARLDAARRGPGSRGRGAGAHLARRAVVRGREQDRPRPPPPGAGPTVGSAPGTPRRCAGREDGPRSPSAYRVPGAARPLASAALCPTRGPGPASAPAVSLRMSMRQPVSRAASRAFWPSRPIASES